MIKGGVTVAKKMQDVYPRGFDAGRLSALVVEAALGLQVWMRRMNEGSLATYFQLLIRHLMMY